MERSRTAVTTSPKHLRQRLLTPVRALSQLEEDMQHWFDDASLLPSEFYNGADFIPQCDLKETNMEYVARFDIPGVKKSDLKIFFYGGKY